MVNINPINPNIVPEPIVKKENNVNALPTNNYSGLSAMRSTGKDKLKTTSKDDKRWVFEGALINAYSIIGIIYGLFYAVTNIIEQKIGSVESFFYGLISFIFVLLLVRSNFARIIIIAADFLLATILVYKSHLAGGLDVILNIQCAFCILTIFFFCLPKIKRHFVSNI